MPAAPVGREGLDAFEARLRPLAACARAGADEVLDHYPEVGDRLTQRALDGYLDQLADLLREVEASTCDLADRVRVLSLSAPRRQVGDDGPRTSATPRTGDTRRWGTR